LLGQGVDTLVLGCTHYPFLRAAIEEITGPALTIIDSGEAVARRTRDVLIQAGIARERGETGQLTLLTTGESEPVSAASSRLLDYPVDAVSVRIERADFAARRG
jgi:glutamate racemase